MEITKIESNIEDIVEKLIDNTPVSFIFNLDEVGHQDFADAEKKRAIVPIYYEVRVDPYAVTRKG